MHCNYNSNYKYNQNSEIMREIRYRGIGIAERKWVFGSLRFDTRNKATLIWSEELKYWVRVDPATVGQYTGLKDEHGKEIYEGDVIRSPLSEDKTRPHRIFYHTGNAAFMGALVDRKELCYLRLDQDWIYKFGKEVIGNIHDNPELIEKQTAERHKNKNSMFKKLDYQVFPSEEKTICVVDDPVYGGAHCYAIQHSEGFSDGKAKYVPVETRIQFVQKNDDGSVINGVQSEQLAYILLDRAIKLNNRFPSPQNEKQIAGLRMFLEGCEERVRDRMNRGVMGDLKQ